MRMLRLRDTHHVVVEIRAQVLRSSQIHPPSADQRGEFVRECLADLGNPVEIEHHIAEALEQAAGPTVWKNPTLRSNRLWFPRAESA
jgi:hypothetical protein